MSKRIRVYHGTSSMDAQSIMDYGLSYYNFVTNDLAAARYYAERAVARRGGRPVVLTTELEPKDIRGAGGYFWDLTAPNDQEAGLAKSWKFVNPKWLLFSVLEGQI